MDNVKLCFDDILLVPRYSELESRTEPDISTKLGSNILQLPIISAPMDSVTGKEMLLTMDKMGGLGILSRHIGMSEDDEIALQCKEISWARERGAKNIGVAIGIKHDTYRLASSLLFEGANYLCLDVANGDNKNVYDIMPRILQLKDTFKFDLIVGNICTTEATERLCEAGADIIRAGIGGGSMCLTRVCTGFGYPQLSVIMECSEVSDRYNKQLIADGGIRNSGDMTKCFFGGANAIMVGYLLAGSNCCPLIDGRKIYRGMSSRQVSGRYDIAAEGIVAEAPDRGETNFLLEEFAKGIKAGLSYGGCRTLEELSSCDYVRITPNCLAENGTRPMWHGV